jgi:aspartyl/asparaginyl-tRNA synthetase
MAAKDTLAFIRVNDGSVWEGIQVVAEEATKGWDLVKTHGVSLAASILVIGKLLDSPGKGQRVRQ